MTISERISRLTYTLQHNPNCPSPFLVRMPCGLLMLDNRLAGSTEDALGYGKTFEEAAANALKIDEAAEQKFLAHLETIRRRA